jgi:hypothetical protein
VRPIVLSETSQIFKQNKNTGSMGLFLSFSLILNSNKEKILNNLEEYAINNRGKLSKEEIEYGDPNFCLLKNFENLCIVTYPEMFVEYEKISETISEKQETTIFTFYIYDSDFWVLLQYENGKLISRFNPFPNYWDSKKEREQLKSWNLNIDDICKKLGCKKNSIENYFIEWGSSNIKAKAYPDDEFSYGDCFQIFDFLQKLNISYSTITNYEKLGETFKLSTEYFPENKIISEKFTIDDIRNAKRYSTNYIRLKPEEIETLLGIEFEYFIELTTTKQNCKNCKVFQSNDKMEDYDYFLSIQDCAIKTTGYCKKCKKKIESGWGLTKIDKLIEVLNR